MSTELAVFADRHATGVLCEVSTSSAGLTLFLHLDGADTGLKYRPSHADARALAALIMAEAT